MKEILEKLIEEHEAEVWEYYKDGYWSKGDFRYEPESGADCIEGFRKWDFDEYMNGAYHYGFVLGVREAMSRIGEINED